MSSDVFDSPPYNPEPYDVEFPVEHDIEYVGGVRVTRMIIQGQILWACEHEEISLTPEDAAANCILYCKEK